MRAQEAASTNEQPKAEPSAQPASWQWIARFSIACLLGTWLVAYLGARLIYDPSRLAFLPTERMKVMLENLPSIVATDDLVLHVGTSETQWGHSTTAFDRASAEGGAPLHSVNFGVFGLTNKVQWQLARRVRQAFELAGRKAKVTIIGFSPSHLCPSVAVLDFLVATSTTHSSLILTPRMFWQLALESPTEAFHVFSRTLLGHAPTADLRKQLLYSVFGPAKGESQQQALLDDLIKREVKHQGAWSLASRGEHHLDVVAPEIYARWISSLLDETYLEQDIKRRRAKYPQFYFDQDFDRREEAYFIDSVKELRAVSQRILIVTPPRMPGVFQLTDAAVKRRQDVLDRIRRETNAEIVDLELGNDYPRGEFFDVLHLNATGAKHWSRELARLSVRSLDAASP